MRIIRPSLAILVVSPFGLAVDICTYSLRNFECKVNVAFGCCVGVPADACCYWNARVGLGLSVSFANVSSSQWIARASSGEDCGPKGETKLVNTTYACLDTPPNDVWNSARWSETAGAIVPALEERRASAGCRTPNLLGFPWNGKDYRVAVPDGRYSEIAELLEKKDFEALMDVAVEVQKHG